MNSFKDDIDTILFSEEDIAGAVARLGDEISRDYEGKDLLLLSVLKGSFVFLADLMRTLTIPARVDFMAVSSYGTGVRSSGVVRITKDNDTDLEGKHLLIVEDILDTGRTLSYLTKLLADRGPESLKIATLLDKPLRRKVPIEPHYCGFEVPDAFLVGYGLDHAELYRNLPYIGILKPEIYQEDEYLSR